MSQKRDSLKRSGAMKQGPSSQGSFKTTDRQSPSNYGTVNETETQAPQRAGTGASGKVDHLVKIRREVDEVKDIMKDNIEKVIERDEKVSILGERADNLVTQSSGFKENAKTVRKNAQRRNWKMCCCIVTLVLVILSIITVVILYALKIL